MRRMYSESQIENIANNSLKPESLADKFEGTIGVSVDVNQEGDKVAVGLDLTGGAAGKVLTVNAAGTDVEWKEASGGADLYQHFITFPFAGTNMTLAFTNTESQAYDYDSIQTYLNNIGATSSDSYMAVQGTTKFEDYSSADCFAVGLWNDGGDLNVRLIYTDISSTGEIYFSGDFTDRVMKI